MPVLGTLVDAVRQEGFGISSGLNPTPYEDFYQAPFTWLTHNGVSVTDDLGVALQELYFLECLAQVRQAEPISPARCPCSVPA
ncbi:hypothetical protein ABZ897_60590 [Nonomuraea sp. NPDC046802]|uniref:hypothetical protein n=1 Tax=Nonomuraea sp. NPDC046802 TaxID=3154919 RepID=UPI0033FB00BC